VENRQILAQYIQEALAELELVTLEIEKLSKTRVEIIQSIAESRKKLADTESGNVKELTTYLN
jgi:hypothetical protein